MQFPLHSNWVSSSQVKSLIKEQPIWAVQLMYKTGYYNQLNMVQYGKTWMILVDMTNWIRYNMRSVISIERYPTTGPCIDFYLHTKLDVLMFSIQFRQPQTYLEKMSSNFGGGCNFFIHLEAERTSWTYPRRLIQAGHHPKSSKISLYRV